MAQEILNVSQLKVGVEDKEILHGVDLSLNKEKLMYLWDLTEQVSLLLVMLLWVIQDMKY